MMMRFGLFFLIFGLFLSPLASVAEVRFANEGVEETTEVANKLPMTDEALSLTFDEELDQQIEALFNDETLTDLTDKTLTEQALDITTYLSEAVETARAALETAYELTEEQLQQLAELPQDLGSKIEKVGQMVQEKAQLNDQVEQVLKDLGLEDEAKKDDDLKKLIEDALKGGNLEKLLDGLKDKKKDLTEEDVKKALEDSQKKLEDAKEDLRKAKLDKDYEKALEKAKESGLEGREAEEAAARQVLDDEGVSSRTDLGGQNSAKKTLDDYRNNQNNFAPVQKLRDWQQPGKDELGSAGDNCQVLSKMLDTTRQLETGYLTGKGARAVLKASPGITVGGHGIYGPYQVNTGSAMKSLAKTSKFGSVSKGQYVAAQDPGKAFQLFAYTSLMHTKSDWSNKYVGNWRQYVSRGCVGSKAQGGVSDFVVKRVAYHSGPGKHVINQINSNKGANDPTARVTTLGVIEHIMQAKSPWYKKAKELLQEIDPKIVQPDCSTNFPLAPLGKALFWLKSASPDEIAVCAMHHVCLYSGKTGDVSTVLRGTPPICGTAGTQ